jgi:anti-sigma regulatory factor (Ser/Thr protein kinase)
VTNVADPPAPLQLRLPAVPSSVTEARVKIADYATGAGADPDDVELAVAEAVANSVLHAFPGEMKGTVTVRATFDGNVLEVEVTDDGTGMRPNPEGDGLGLGLALIGRLSASFAVSEPANGGTSLRMSFPCDTGRSEDG